MSVTFILRLASEEELSNEPECFNCGNGDPTYIVVPESVVLCKECAHTDLAVRMGASGTPRGSGYIPLGLTSEQYEAVASMTVPPACIHFRPFSLATEETLEDGRRRITFEFVPSAAKPL